MDEWVTRRCAHSPLEDQRMENPVQARVRQRALFIKMTASAFLIRALDSGSP
ncbi:MAG: hypothetical protein ABI945_08755 [Nitrospirales bacterium]